MDKISGGFMLSTFVMRPCMMRKCGLLTLSCTEWNRFCTRLWPKQRVRTLKARRLAAAGWHAAATSHAPGLCHVSVDEVLVAAANDNLRGRAARVSRVVSAWQRAAPRRAWRVTVICSQCS